MRKTHIKLGLLIAMTCLFLAVGTVIGGADASAHNVQATRKFRPWFTNRPHISVRLLANKAHHSSHSYSGLAVVSGVGFNACGSCAPTVPAPSSSSACDSSCNSDSNANSANSADTSCSSSDSSSDTSCSTSTSSSTTTTTTTTITTTSPSTSSNTVPSQSTSSNTVPSQSTTCSTTCSNTVPSTVPAASTCPSYNTCGNTAPAVAPAPAPSDDDCSCNTVNLQSSAPISASGINLSQVPVNAFGEFQVTVNVQPTARQNTVPTVWAVNSYNDQPSNSASMCCSYTYCCQ